MVWDDKDPKISLVWKPKRKFWLRYLAEPGVYFASLEEVEEGDGISQVAHYLIVMLCVLFTCLNVHIQA